MQCNVCNVMYCNVCNVCDVCNGCIVCVVCIACANQWFLMVTCCIPCWLTDFSDGHSAKAYSSKSFCRTCSEGLSQTGYVGEYRFDLPWAGTLTRFACGCVRLLYIHSHPPRMISIWRLYADSVPKLNLRQNCRLYICELDERSMLPDACPTLQLHSLSTHY